MEKGQCCPTDIPMVGMGLSPWDGGGQDGGGSVDMGVPAWPAGAPRPRPSHRAGAGDKATGMEGWAGVGVCSVSLSKNKKQNRKKKKKKKKSVLRLFFFPSVVVVVVVVIVHK